MNATEKNALLVPIKEKLDALLETDIAAVLKMSREESEEYQRMREAQFKAFCKEVAAIPWLTDGEKTALCYDIGGHNRKTAGNLFFSLRDYARQRDRALGRTPAVLKKEVAEY